MFSACAVLVLFILLSFNRVSDFGDCNSFLLIFVGFAEVGFCSVVMPGSGGRFACVPVFLSLAYICVWFACVPVFMSLAYICGLGLTLVT